jgi:hypothetical protein
MKVNDALASMTFGGTVLIFSNDTLPEQFENIDEAFGRSKRLDRKVSEIKIKMHGHVAEILIETL